MPETAQINTAISPEPETDRRAAPAVQDALDAIGTDCQAQAAQYLADTVVPHGGE